MKSNKPITEIYQKVYNEFMRKLEEQVKRGDFPQESIAPIRQSIIQKLDRSYDLLKLKYKRYKDRTIEQKKQKQRERELKIEQELLNAGKLQVEPQVKARESQKDIDDNQFFVDLEEERPKQEVKQQPTQTKLEDQQSDTDEQGNQKEQKIEFANENLEMYLVGQSGKKKYIAKQEKITVELEDVIIKYRDKEDVYKSISCNFTNLKIADLRI